jgi:hypothetical protein
VLLARAVVVLTAKPTVNTSDPAVKHSTVEGSHNSAFAGETPTSR